MIAIAPDALHHGGQKPGTRNGELDAKLALAALAIR